MTRAISVLLLLSASLMMAAQPIDVPNYSFESPAVTRDQDNPYGALPWIDDWDETAVGPDDEMDPNTGVFLNTDPGDPDYVTNADLDRLAFISSLIGNDLRQELTATFVPGRHYRLTVGVAKSLRFPVGDDEPLEIGLYYRDDEGEHLIVSSYVAGGHVSSTFLTDVAVLTRAVSADDPWANQPIGILIRPAIDDPDDTVDEGFWDLDNVRLEWFPPLAGDIDGNGNVDEQDLAAFYDCFTGPAVGPVAPGCEPADTDGDGDVDQVDFARLQANFYVPG